MTEINLENAIAQYMLSNNLSVRLAEEGEPPFISFVKNYPTREDGNKPLSVKMLEISYDASTGEVVDSYCDERLRTDLPNGELFAESVVEYLAELPTTKSKMVPLRLASRKVLLEIDQRIR